MVVWGCPKCKLYLESLIGFLDSIETSATRNDNNVSSPARSMTWARIIGLCRAAQLWRGGGRVRCVVVLERVRLIM